jgi:hypothetical protein
MKRPRLLLAAAAGLALSSALAVTAGPAAAAGTGSATFTGQPGSYVAGGQTLTLPVTSGPAFRGTSVVTFAMDSPEHWFQLWFAPPEGEHFHLGTYEGAERADFRSPGHPGIDLFGDGRGCNTLKGRFTVTRLRLDPTGLPTDFAATFEFTCEGFLPPVSGSIDYLGTYRSYQVSTGALDFGAVRNRGTVDRTITITNDGTEPLAITPNGIAGANAADFALVTSTCSGAGLAPAEACTITVRFRPTGRPGQRTATLTVVDDSGLSKAVQLGGSIVPPGLA